MRRKRDIDAWDSVCDHLLVLDKAIEGDSEDQIVGTYRLLRQETALANNGFYSASEFDIAGNAIQTVQATDAKKVITVRPTAFAAAAEGGSAPEIAVRPL